MMQQQRAYMDAHIAPPMNHLSIRIPHRLRMFILLVVLIVGVPLLLHAQSNVITANPNAQPLRKIWELRGRMEEQMGYFFGSVGDINGDSLDDFGVSDGSVGKWRLYYGNRDSLSQLPFWTRDSMGGVAAHPTVGRFWGTRPALVLSRYYRDTVGSNTPFFLTLEIFRTDSLRLDTVPSLVLDMRKMSPRIFTAPRELLAYDLDGDGYDELIFYLQIVQRDTSIDRHPQVWIYRGGPEFKVDSPTVILRDVEEQNDYGFQMYVGRFDDDPYPDLMYGFERTDRTSKLAVYFGTASSPWTWSQPDRTFNVGAVALLDCNGDSLMDIAQGYPSRHVSVFLSGEGKSLRTRSLMLDDVDIDFEGDVGLSPERLGYLSDSGRRFEMLGIQQQLFHVGLSGGPRGPDHIYDVYSSEIFRPPFLQPLGDVTGDGWNDLITGRFSYENRNGVARVFAGGPYIPRDPSSGVRTLPTDERADAIHIWPNPTTTELHIAWRGDLKQMPRGFSVFDITGQLVAHGEVASWRGEVIWNCTEVMAGSYLLSIYDYTGALLTTTTVTKE